MIKEVSATVEARKVLNDVQNKILNSDEYAELMDELKAVEERVDAMRKPVNEAQKAVTMAETILLGWAVKNEKYETDNFVVKFRETKEVNKEKLFGVIGDIDAFVSISSVTQKNLKDYAKDNKDLKKSLENCIEVVDKKPISVTLI